MLSDSQWHHRDPTGENIYVCICVMYVNDTKWGKQIIKESYNVTKLI